MRIIFKDPKGRTLKLVVDSMDDMWTLYHVIAAGDMVHAAAYRREEKVSDKLRSEKSEKKRMHLGIEVEKVEFHEFSNRLRIQGIIREGPQDLGQYHTLNVSSGDELSITKEDWQEYQVQMIADALKNATTPAVIMLAIEENEAVIAVLRTYGIQESATISGHISGKMYDSSSAKSEKIKFYSEVLDALMQVKKECNLRASAMPSALSASTTTINKAGERGTPGELPLIVLGPGFAKEEFCKFAVEKVSGFAAHIEPTGQGGITGIYEAIKRGAVKNVVKESRIAYETELVEKLFSEISKNGNVCYGFKEVENALNMGAVDVLLVTDKSVRSQCPSTGVGTGKKKQSIAEHLLQLAKNVNSRIAIISTIHEGGAKLHSIGGVGALLRYKMHRAE